MYFLDDPLSAVDVHVGQHLMTACICGLLAEKTRIVVTHQLQFLPFADTVMVINDGHIDELGTYQACTLASTPILSVALAALPEADMQLLCAGCRGACQPVPNCSILLLSC